jgi:SAM-dependent methyltransferase
MIEDLESSGCEVGEVLLVDHDPMALATACGFAESAGLDGRTTPLLEDLTASDSTRARDLEELVRPGSIDLVDLLGLFEYFPDELAVDLLGRVRQVLRPGGLVVFGNMLSVRPQQIFFTHVSLWPPLFQRSLTQLLELVERAGFGRDGLELVVPAEGVYATVAARA